MIRVLIADDEAPSRVRMRQLLAVHADVEIAGEAGTGVEAMELAVQLQPDVIFLDIQMPGSSGIDVAASLPKPRPHVIFCTAYDQYAIQAFELDAVDYLLKPIVRARLAQAMERVRPLPQAADREVALDRALRRQRSAPSRFLVRSGSQYVVIGETRVLYFGSEGSLTRLVADNGQYWMDPTLNDLQARLHPTRFFRISRSALVHLNAVTAVVPMAGSGGEVVLKDGQRLEVSRRRFRDLLEALGGLGRGDSRGGADPD